MKEKQREIEAFYVIIDFLNGRSSTLLTNKKETQYFPQLQCAERVIQVL